tara:strand:- start:1 stop:1230 length:1230 start_codon:yes stop_codon:yes gene_type:complete
MYTGPKLTNDNLVFGYDTGYGIADNATATRFYPGQPSVNLFGDISNANARPNRTEHNTSAWTANFPKPPEDVGRVYSHTSGSLNSTWSGNSYGYTLIAYSYLANTTYTLSCWVYVSPDANITGMGASMESTTLTHTANRNYDLSNKGTWQQISLRCNSSSAVSGNAIIAYPSRTGVTDGSHTGFWAIGGAKLETNDQVTPYVLGTRSDTASLIDLKKTTDIDVSNVSFTSTGQPSYDETDDHITGVLPISGLGQPHTIEMIFSCNVNQGSIGSRKDPFTIGNSTTHQYSALDVNATNMNWYFYSKDTTFTNSPLMVADQFYHIVLSYAGGYSNNTNKKVWINGVQQTLSSGVNENPLLPNNPSFSVGRDRGRNTAYWPGEIPVWKVYQKALTQEDAISNYKAYKNRFNL